MKALHITPYIFLGTWVISRNYSKGEHLYTRICKCFFFLFKIWMYHISFIHMKWRSGIVVHQIVKKNKLLQVTTQPSTTDKNKL